MAKHNSHASNTVPSTIRTSTRVGTPRMRKERLYDDLEISSSGTRFSEKARVNGLIRKYQEVKRQHSLPRS